jgi:hypothetical protein
MRRFNSIQFNSIRNEKEAKECLADEDVCLLIGDFKIVKSLLK